MTDGKAAVTTTFYDALDRVTKTAVTGGPTVEYGYDPGGRLTSRIDASGTTTYLYDRLNRLVEKNLPGGATNAYTYDGVGNLKSVTDAGGTVAYEYNDVNLVDRLTEPGGNVSTFEYYDDNSPKSTTYPNGVVQTATYDESNRIETIVGTKGLTTLTSFGYDYKLAGVDTGLRQSVTHMNGNVTTYDYDELDRLEAAQTKNILGIVVDSFAYAYDAVGNRTSDTANGVTTSAFHDAADQLTSRGSVSYSYDTNGNQTASSAGQALAYNSLDQTTSLKKAGGTALAATYAGPGQVERTSAGATSFTNTQLGVTATNQAGATVSTTRDPGGVLIGLRSGANRSYYLVDGLGSVVALTDSSGAVTHSYSYDPYGVTTETTSSSVSNPWRYTGQYFDVSTGLYKMGARYYQPELGRWTQVDPSGQDANAYLYVGGNPINFVDPSGLATEFGDCLIFRYNNATGSCFGGNLAEVLGEAVSDIGGVRAIPTCYYAAEAGAALGALVTGPFAFLGAPTGAGIGCIGALGVTALVNRLAER